MKHPSLLAQDALEDAAQDFNATTAANTRETAAVYAMLAIAEGLESVATAIDNLKKDFISVEVLD